MAINPYATIDELGAMLRNKQVSAVELANFYLAREIEARGVPTLVISASPAATESVRPPRAMTFEGSAIGRIIGRAGDREFHRKVIVAALEMFTHITPPGKVVTKQILSS